MMGPIREEIGDVLEPDENKGEQEEEIQQDSTISYPIHYSEGAQGHWSVLNFSEPYGKRQLTPDYAAQKIDEGEYDRWRVSAEEGTVEVSIDPDIDTKDELADELKTAYHENI